MRLRTTLILFSLTLVLGLYILLVESKRPSRKEREETADRVVQVKAPEIKEVSIEKTAKNGKDTGKQEILLVRGAGNTWTMKKPVHARADSGKISSLATRLELLDADRFVHDPDLADLGLEHPLLVAHFKTGEKDIKLSFGKEDPTSRRVYVAVEKRVAVIDKSFMQALDKPADDFRDKRVFPCDSFQVVRADFSTGDEHVTLEKQGSSWRITRPVSTKAYDTEAERLIEKATGMKVLKFTGNKADRLSAFGLDPAHASIELKLSNNKTYTLYLSGPRDNKRYAKLGGEPFIVQVKENSLKGLLLPDLSLLKDRKVFDLSNGISRDTVDYLKINNAGKTVELKKQGDEWKLNQENKAARFKVEDRVGEFLDLVADRVVEDPGPKKIKPNKPIYAELGVKGKTVRLDLAYFTKKGQSGEQKVFLKRQGSKNLLEIEIDPMSLFSAKEKDFRSALDMPKVSPESESNSGPDAGSMPE
ncbi:MAG: DUF4340 domain-containing protein [Deltaproteobacteria bacterium]|nr:DUF4340 domain-containing protein [Deltaproteobacteria bacterium]